MPQRQFAMLIPPTNDDSRRIMRGVIHYVHQWGGWEFVTREAMPSIDWADLRHFRGDGIIAMVYNLDQYRRLRRRGTPCINVCTRCSTPDLPLVCSDNPAIGRLAAATLWEKGLRQFAFVGRPKFDHDYTRGEGFRAELIARGADCRTIELEPLPHQPHDIVDIGKIAQWLRGLPRPVGIFAAHDRLGCQILSACRGERIQVPQEAAVLSVDDFTLLCETARPTLSSIRKQSERIGYEAMRLLAAIIDGTADPLTQVALPPARVVERRSTEMLAVEDLEVSQALVFIRNNLHRSITAKDIADHVALSRRGLDHRFVAMIGHTPMRELRQARLRRAEQLLTQTNLAVTEISLRCGFGSASSFDRAFREATSTTPRQYRNQRGEVGLGGTG